MNQQETDRRADNSAPSQLETVKAVEGTRQPPKNNPDDFMKSIPSYDGQWFSWPRRPTGFYIIHI